MIAPVYDTGSFVPEIEQNVLGALMFGGNAQETLAALHDYHFIELFHQHLYRAIKSARERYGVTSYSVVSKLIPEDQIAAFEKANGTTLPAYLARLLSTATSGASNSMENARKIVEQWARLSIANEAGRVYAAANDPSSDVRVIVHDAARQFDDIMAEVRSGPTRKTRLSLETAASMAIDSAVQARKNGSGLTGITWGLADLNRLTGGIQRRDLTLIGARPSMGKSTFAFSTALKAAKAGHCTGLISLEMDNEKVAARIISDFLYDWQTRIPYTDIIRGIVTDDQIDLIADAQLRFNELPLLMEDQSGLTITDIRIRAERMMEESRKAGNTMSSLFVDHLGLIRASARYSGNRVQEIGELTSGLKTLARELDIAVVLLSQLNRAVESRDNKRPQLSDLRDSGAIEQDADMIAFLYREAYYLEREQGGTFEQQSDRADMIAEKQNTLEFIIAKQRNGPIQTVELFADMAFSAVRNGVRLG